MFLYTLNVARRRIPHLMEKGGSNVKKVLCGPMPKKYSILQISINLGIKQLVLSKI
jgi:hypothetical protein